MDNSDEAKITEGYLEKRFKSGIVKSLKKKWFVLKDRELRCYQNKDACQQNVDMYQDCLPICNVQTVRAASDGHGVEVVTQQKVLMLVASSAEDQQKWIKAIYEMMKDDRPQLLPATTGTTGKSRKRSSTGPKVSISRILPLFTRKSSENLGQPRFYVESDPDIKPEYAEIGVQANVTQNSECKKVDEKKIADDVLDTQDTLDNTSIYTEQAINTEKSGESDHSTESGRSGSPYFDSESPADDLEISGNHVASVDNPPEVAAEQNMDDDGMSYDTKQENGMQELKLMLRNSSLLASEGEGDEDGSCYGDDIDLEDSDETFSDDETENGKSAFEQLQELLKT